MVRITQLLCPRRHCIVARAWESSRETDEQALEAARALWREMVERGGMNPYCALCGSTDLQFETGQTRFRTLAEAEPFLRAEEAKNLLTQAILLRDLRRN
jgi:hypothetical protein